MNNQPTMTTTPHPADALPLPEPFMAMCRDTVPHIYAAWEKQIRAARREGYELRRLQALAAPAQEQPSKCSICGGTGQVEQYTSANAPKVKVKCPFCAGDGKCRTPQSCVPHGCHGGCLPVEQQQAGATEVSDEQIEKLAHRMCWQYRHSTDPHHSNTYKFNLVTLLDYSRAILALKATAGGVA